MNPFLDFLLKNFFLFCLALGIVFMVLRSYRTDRRITLLPILVVGSALLLSILYFIETLSVKNPDLVFLTTLCFALAFMIRPIVLYLFMRFTIDNKTIILISRIMIIVNAAVYSLSLLLFIPNVAHLVIKYVDGEAIRGPLFYTCHIMMGVMMGYFVIHSLISLKGKHRYDVIACLICFIFILLAVLLETLLVSDYILNTSIAISCLFYVIYLYQQASIKDPLTGLYERKAYYADLDRIKSKVKGIIVIDMNSLKQLNDSEGHVAGDQALKTIAEAIEQSIDYKTMDAYRVGGDEFIILSLTQNEEILNGVRKNIREKLSSTRYRVAIGFATRNSEEEISMHELTLKADEYMYADKAKYYKDNKIDRRRK